MLWRRKTKIKKVKKVRNPVESNTLQDVVVNKCDEVECDLFLGEYNLYVFVQLLSEAST